MSVLNELCRFTGAMSLVPLHVEVSESASACNCVLCLSRGIYTICRFFAVVGDDMSRILIIEDEAGIARFVELELKHEGNEVEKAADGREGLDKALSGSFDLILLDVMLPGLNGMEVLRRLRQEKDTPVIMLTARDAVMDKVAGLDAGADDYITKPFAIEELLARIRVALKKHMRTEGAPTHKLEVLGVCLEKKRSYCQFDSKLAQIVQQQGRNGQLRISFGSAKHPDCRGITVDELQKIQFDRLDFTNFYEDLMNNQKIPDSGVLTQKVKEQIADQLKQAGQ